MTSIQLKCGYTQIFLISEGKKNLNLSASEQIAIEKTFSKLEVDRHDQRLAENYQLERLHLDKMFSFSIIYDFEKSLPVFITGVQKVGSHSARVFSRYFMFPEYRTLTNQHGLLNKIDDFEVLQNELKLAKPHFSFIFWSRDKGNRFFKKIKVARPDIFSDWQIYPETIELLYQNNYQGLLYYKTNEHSADYFIETDLKFK